MERIGVGKSAEVYQMNENCVAKIFYDERCESTIENEIRCMKLAKEQGFMVPEYYGRDEINGRQAILMEYLHGESMLHVLMKPYCNLEKLMEDFATLQYDLHQCKNTEVTRVNDILLGKINETNLLDEKTRKLIINLMESLPYGNSLCHLDYHPDNILITKKGMYVIDWCDIGCGNPMYDVARTVLLLEYGSLPDGIPDEKKMALSIARKKLIELYLRTYRKLAGDNDFNIQPYKVISAAARLCCEERDSIPLLLKLIKDYFK